MPLYYIVMGAIKLHVEFMNEVCEWE